MPPHTGRHASSLITIDPSGRRQTTVKDAGERIITPSMTAWPPTSGRFASPTAAAASRPTAAYPWPWPLVRPYFLLKRSTRPALSSSFCLPV